MKNCFKMLTQLVANYTLIDLRDVCEHTNRTIIFLYKWVTFLIKWCYLGFFKSIWKDGSGKCGVY